MRKLARAAAGCRGASFKLCIVVKLAVVVTRRGQLRLNHGLWWRPCVRQRPLPRRPRANGALQQLGAAKCSSRTAIRWSPRSPDLSGHHSFTFIPARRAQRCSHLRLQGRRRRVRPFSRSRDWPPFRRRARRLGFRQRDNSTITKYFDKAASNYWFQKTQQPRNPGMNTHCQALVVYFSLMSKISGNHDLAIDRGNVGVTYPWR